jgi:hypothetical protein
MTWPGLTQNVEQWLFTLYLSSMSNDNEGATKQECGLLQPKIAESDTIFLGNGLCGSGGSIYNKDTSQNTLSAWTHYDRSRNQHRLVWIFWRNIFTIFEISIIHSQQNIWVGKWEQW